MRLVIRLLLVSCMLFLAECEISCPAVYADMNLEEALHALGLGPGFSSEELKRHYRSYAKRFHPDTGGADADPQKFRRVQEAYEFLKSAPVSSFSREQALELKHFFNISVLEQIDDKTLQEMKSYLEVQRAAIADFLNPAGSSGSNALSRPMSQERILDAHQDFIARKVVSPYAADRALIKLLEEQATSIPNGGADNLLLGLLKGQVERDPARLSWFLKSDQFSGIRSFDRDFQRRNSEAIPKFRKTFAALALDHGYLPSHSPSMVLPHWNFWTALARTNPQLWPKLAKTLLSEFNNNNGAQVDGAYYVRLEALLREGGRSLDSTKFQFVLNHMDRVVDWKTSNPRLYRSMMDIHAVNPEELEFFVTEPMLSGEKRVVLDELFGNLRQRQPEVLGKGLESYLKRLAATFKDPLERVYPARLQFINSYIKQSKINEPSCAESFSHFEH